MGALSRAGVWEGAGAGIVEPARWLVAPGSVVCLVLAGVAHRLASANRQVNAILSRLRRPMQASGTSCCFCRRPSGEHQTATTSKGEEAFPIACRCIRMH